MRKVLIGVLLLCLTPQAGLAQSTATATIQPVKWEYLTALTTMKQGQMVYMTLEGDKEVSLKDLGVQGWELVGVSNVFMGQSAYLPLAYFKRQKR